MITLQEVIVTLIPFFSVLLVLLYVGFQLGKTGSATRKPRATGKPALPPHTPASKRASKGGCKKQPGNLILSENFERPCGNKARRKALNRKSDKRNQQLKRKCNPASRPDLAPPAQTSTPTPPPQNSLLRSQLWGLLFYWVFQKPSLRTLPLRTSHANAPKSPTPSSPSSASSTDSSAASVSAGNVEFASTPSTGSAAQAAGKLSWWPKMWRSSSWRAAAKSAPPGTSLHPYFDIVAASHSGTQSDPATQGDMASVQHEGVAQATLSSSAVLLAASDFAVSDTSKIVSHDNVEQQQQVQEVEQQRNSAVQCETEQAQQQSSGPVAQTQCAMQQQQQQQQTDQQELPDSTQQSTAQPKQAQQQGTKESLHHQQGPACDGTTASQLCTAEQMQKQLAARDAQVAGLTEQLQQQCLDSVLAKGESAGITARLHSHLAQQAAALARANVVIAEGNNASAALAQAQAVIAEQKAALAQRDADIANQQAVIARQGADIAEQRAKLDQRDARAISQTAAVVKHNKELANCRLRMAHMAEMEQKLSRLQEAESLRHPEYAANELPDRSAFGGVRPTNPERVFNPLQGTGGAGFVEAAQTHLLGSHVYKWPHDKCTEEEDNVKEQGTDLEEEEDDLEEEAKFLSLFRHPFVVSYYGRCMDTLGTLGLQGKRGLVLEKMDMSADKLLKQQKALPLEALVKIGTNIASALAFVHNMGFLHADVKPDNVGVSHFGSPGFIAKLLDFGLVKRIGQEWHDTKGIGMPMNVHFAPPEFCSVKRRGGTVYPMDSSADVWSFGLVLAQAAGLHRVSNSGHETDCWVNFIAKLEGEYPVGLAVEHMVLQWQDGRQYLGLHYPKEFQDIVNQCLSANPEDRPTMRQVVERLQEVPLTGDPDLAWNDAQPLSSDSESASSGSGPDESGSEWQDEESSSESECEEYDSNFDPEGFDDSNNK